MIPDPGRASKAVEQIVASAPFDAIRIETLEGREYWSARDLMPLLGYERWERFADAVDRAKRSAHNAGYDVAQHFAQARKVIRDAAKNLGGRPAEDVHLSRYACYLIALNGDPRKQEIANAQTYFVIKTREAEVAQPVTSVPAVMPTHAEALRNWAKQLERAERAESKVVELTGPATSWNELAEAQGDYAVSDAAKVLARGGVATGERRLFVEMSRLRWVFKRDSRWRAYQTQIDLGRLTEKVGKPYVRNGEVQNGDPTVRITPKGLGELHRLLGNGGEQLALASVE